jgi:hypothetical protein
MSAQVVTLHPKTAKPVIAGVFNIIFGSFILLAFLGLVIAAIVTAATSDYTTAYLPLILGLVSLPVLAVGLLELFGGIFAIQRKLWGVALTASIVLAIGSTVFGVAAIVLIAVSKDEFAT